MSHELDSKLGAALERVGQALRGRAWSVARSHGLTPMQMQLLLRLAADPPERRRVGALAAELDVSHPTVSDAVAVLRRKGLVERVRDDGDQRAWRLALTTDGRRVAGEAAAWDAPVAATLARLPAARKEHALELLLELIAGLQRAGVVSVARMCTTCRFFRPDAHAGPRPHHCALLDAALAPAELRVDCPEHEAA